MKLASSLGKYDEEWKEGDCATPPKGEVPCIAILFIHVSEVQRAVSAENVCEAPPDNSHQSRSCAGVGGFEPLHDPNKIRGNLW
jgi:hypothetical protein